MVARVRCAEWVAIERNDYARDTSELDYEVAPRRTATINGSI